MLSSLAPPLTLPRARVEPIRNATEALSVVSLAISRPLREELVVITCDRFHAGQSIVVFGIRATLEQLAHDVIGHVSTSPNATGAIIADVRPFHSPLAHDNMKHALSSCLDRAGLRLLHFFGVRHGEVSLARQ